MAGLTFDFAQTVAIGPFNPHIITPGWLAKEKIAVEVADDYDSFPNLGDEDGSGFALGGFEWNVSLSRLSVASGKPSWDCGAKAAAVMEKLCHTPVQAVGNNFVFTCPPDAWAGRPVPTGGEMPPGMKAVDSRWVGQFRDSARGEVGPLVEADLLYSPEVVVVQLNYHRVTGGDSQAGRDAANEFLKDHDRARAMVKHLFGIEVIA